MAQEERLRIDDLLTPFGKVVVSLLLLLLVIYLVFVQLHLVKLDNKVDFLERANVPTAIVFPTVASPSAEIVSPTASPAARFKISPTPTVQLRKVSPTVTVTAAPVKK